LIDHTSNKAYAPMKTKTMNAGQVRAMVRR